MSSTNITTEQHEELYDLTEAMVKLFLEENVTQFNVLRIVNGSWEVSYPVPVEAEAA